MAFPLVTDVVDTNVADDFFTDIKTRVGFPDYHYQLRAKGSPETPVFGVSD